MSSGKRNTNTRIPARMTRFMTLSSMSPKKALTSPAAAQRYRWAGAGAGGVRLDPFAKRGTWRGLYGHSPRSGRDGDPSQRGGGEAIEAGVAHGLAHRAADPVHGPAPGPTLEARSGSGEDVHDPAPLELDHGDQPVLVRRA